MANKHLKRCSVSLASIEMQVKSMRYHYTPIKIAKIKIVTTNASKDEEKPDHLNNASRHVKWNSHSGKDLALSLETKHATKICSDSTL